MLTTFIVSYINVFVRSSFTTTTIAVNALLHIAVDVQYYACTILDS